jgi:hypothetical protein
MGPPPPRPRPPVFAPRPSSLSRRRWPSGRAGRLLTNLLGEYDHRFGSNSPRMLSGPTSTARAGASHAATPPPGEGSGVAVLRL